MLANISQFESLSEGAEQPNLSVFNPEWSTVENDGFDATVGGTPPVTPIPSLSSDLSPAIPQWGRKLDERVTVLEQKVTALDKKVTSGFAEINTKLEQLLASNGKRTDSRTT